ELLAIGGGFPARYDRPVPSIEEIARHTLTAVDRLPYRPRRIVCEPGRALVAESGVIAATVIGREQRYGSEWVYLDVGAYNGLMEAAQTKATWAFPLLTSRRHAAPPLVRRRLVRACGRRRTSAGLGRASRSSARLSTPHPRGSGRSPRWRATSHRRGRCAGGGPPRPADPVAGRSGRRRPGPPNAWRPGCAPRLSPRP